MVYVGIKDDSFNQLIEEEKKLQAQIDALQKQLIENERQKQAAIDALLRKEVLNLLGFKPTDLKQPADVTKVTDKLSQLLATKKKVESNRRQEGQTGNYVIRENKTKNRFQQANSNQVLRLNAPKKVENPTPNARTVTNLDEALYENIPTDDINRARNSLTEGIQKSYKLATASLEFDTERNVFVVNDNKTRLGFTQPRTQKIPTLRVDGRGRPTKASMWIVKANLPRLSNKEAIKTDPVGFAEGFTRGHLIARSLFDDRVFKTKNTKRTNLTPQTQWSNGVLQAEIEKEVLEAVKSHDNVRYQVEPLYHSSGEVIPRCYHIQARSRDGKFKLNVIVPNVEPGFKINYATGTMTPAD
ncbi:DNA/RNA non-specific endonuclease [Ligilactobacillus agilis]|uniref:DNA/RNA non-specific endonuclease n=1 Tax=Ligilactobacillus agilis TaxID=1601 RepID=UPI00242CF42B|nr:DNA/RNA non-specific endonuclease [Ligilactobacillus agilis]